MVKPVRKASHIPLTPMPSVLADVRILVETLPLQIESPIGNNDSLVASGILDSMALFSLNLESVNQDVKV